ncbi:MAG: 30S ribosomal protein S3, partial [Acidobacteriota bacterium]
GGGVFWGGSGRGRGGGGLCFFGVNDPVGGGGWRGVLPGAGGGGGGGAGGRGGGLGELVRGPAGVREAWGVGSGCLVVVTDAARAPGVEEQIRERYRLAGGVEPRVYRGPAAGGAGRQG